MQVKKKKKLVKTTSSFVEIFAKHFSCQWQEKRQHKYLWRNTKRTMKFSLWYVQTQYGFRKNKIKTTALLYSLFIYNNVGGGTVLLSLLLLIWHAPDDVRIAWRNKKNEQSQWKKSPWILL